MTRQRQLSTLRVPIGSLAATILGEQGLWQLLTDRSCDRAELELLANSI